MKVGINLAAPVYFARGWVFDNVLQMSRDWMFGDDPAEVVPTFQDGYPDFSQITPGRSVLTSMFVNSQGRYPGGYYLFSFRGNGQISFSSNVEVVSEFAGFQLLEVDPSLGALGLIIDSSDPLDHLRDMVLIPLNEFGGSSFQKPYLDHVKRFDTIRFMNWQGINNSITAPTVEGRKTPQSVRQYGQGTGRALPAGSDGVAIELMVDLCNQTGVNPWFCMFHLFNEEYVRTFARLVRDTLDPNLKIRLEWSNEAWNSQFAVFKWVQDEAALLGVRPQEIVKREAERNWDIWFEEFAGQEDRLIRVVSGHNGSPNFAQVLLNTGIQADELAVAPYVAPRRSRTQNYDESTTVDQIFADIELDMPAIMNNVKLHADLASNFDLDLVCYEGGQGIIPRQTWNQVAWAAQFDSRMTDLYNTYLPDLQDRGVTLFCHFDDISDQFSNFGSWGASEFQDEDGIKMQALLDFIGQPPPPNLIFKIIGKLKKGVGRIGRQSR